MTTDLHEERSLANTIENITVGVCASLVLIGGYRGNVLGVRGGNDGTDWGVTGPWLMVAALCLVVGLGLTAVCRQLAKRS